MNFKIEKFEKFFLKKKYEKSDFERIFHYLNESVLSASTEKFCSNFCPLKTLDCIYAIFKEREREEIMKNRQSCN